MFEGGAIVITFYEIVRILDKVVGLTKEYTKLWLRVSSLIFIVYGIYWRTLNLKSGIVS